MQIFLKLLLVIFQFGVIRVNSFFLYKCDRILILQQSVFQWRFLFVVLIKVLIESEILLLRIPINLSFALVRTFLEDHRTKRLSYFLVQLNLFFPQQSLKIILNTFLLLHSFAYFFPFIFLHGLFLYLLLLFVQRNINSSYVHVFPWNRVLVNRRLSLNLPQYFQAVGFLYNFDGNVRRLRGLHHLNVREGNYLVVNLSALTSTNLHHVKQVLLSLRLHFEVLNKQLRVLSESLLHSVLHFLLFSINAANEIHFLQLLQMQKSFLFGFPFVLLDRLSALRKPSLLFHLQLVQIPYVLISVCLVFLRTELLAFLLKVRSLNEGVDFLRILHVNRGSQLFLLILLVSFLGLQVVFLIEELSAKNSDLVQVVFQRRDVLFAESFQRTVALETRQPLFPALVAAGFLRANAQF